MAGDGAQPALQHGWCTCTVMDLLAGWRNRLLCRGASLRLAKK